MNDVALAQKKARICVGLGMAQARDFEIDIPPSDVVERYNNLSEEERKVVRWIEGREMNKADFLSPACTQKLTLNSVRIRLIFHKIIPARARSVR
ncbi:hypothetical protein NPIL_279492 [Nephila pilipes]|uniref:Uncharacterized protein n=1 Tax=Nephila pilipes TaxID=299642 RepID=A0A8X6MWJ5_NEPPI|nr:hypothetical protein NPIL_279492 [Nephila pilipes]